MKKNKKILVPGGAGFIGSHLCEKLLNFGNKVYCVDNLLTGKKRNISHLIKNYNFKFIKKDVNKKTEKIQPTIPIISPNLHAW